MQLSELRDLMALLTADTKLHICIHDLSGILTQFHIDSSNTIHFTEVCNFAKTTQRGLDLCLKCKFLANKKAINKKIPFKGMCPLGVTEYVYPVIIDTRVMCIIYLGNICEDIHITEKRMKSVCKITDVGENITDTIKSMETRQDDERYKKIAEALQSYIILMYSYADMKPDKQMHWAVQAFTNYADTYFNKDITITDLAKLYNINKKYAGRLFKRQMQMSFKEYLNIRRIETAKKLLSYTGMNITETALECGYNNVTYFNRMFKQHTGVTPREYRGNKTNKLIYEVKH